MSNDAALFDDILAAAKKYSPKTEVVPKSTSSMHKFFGAVLKLFGNPLYMSDYWTTIGFEIAQPGGKEVDKSMWYTVPHETVHAYQAKRLTRPIFGALYLLGTPVYCVPPLLGSWPLFVWVSWWAGLLFILPFLLISFPPFGLLRARFEMQAYNLSVAQRYWTEGEVTDDYLENRSKQFTSGMYFWMLPFKKTVMKRLNQARKDAVSGDVFKHKTYGGYYKSMYNVLLKHGRIKKPY